LTSKSGKLQFRKKLSVPDLGINSNNTRHNTIAPAFAVILSPLFISTSIIDLVLSLFEIASKKTTDKINVASVLISHNEYDFGILNNSDLSVHFKGSS